MHSLCADKCVQAHFRLETRSSVCVGSVPWLLVWVRTYYRRTVFSVENRDLGSGETNREEPWGCRRFCGSRSRPHDIRVWDDTKRKSEMQLIIIIIFSVNIIIYYAKRQHTSYKTRRTHSKVHTNEPSITWISASFYYRILVVTDDCSSLVVITVFKS